jgi:hypothetical protein
MHKRELVPYADVECYCPLNPEGSIFNGLVLNISKSGICINSLKPIEKGQKIILKSKNPRFSRKAVVRWIENVTLVFFRIGLEFTEC